MICQLDGRPSGVSRLVGNYFKLLLPKARNKIKLLAFILWCWIIDVILTHLLAIWCKRFVQQHFNSFFPTLITVLAEVTYLVFCISCSFHGCLTCSLIKTAMKILRKIRTLLVYFHSFCTSVFSTSNLMSSQGPIMF